MNRIIEEDAGRIADADLDWERLEGRVVLVAGATGYVPQYFIHGLLKRNDLYRAGIKVIALCRSKERALKRFSDYIGRSDFECILQDVCEPLAYPGKIDYVIHAASPAGIRERYRDYLSTFRANVIGCGNLLEAAHAHGACMLFLSSVDVYGRIDADARLREDMSGVLDPLEERNIYSCAKRAAETYCLTYARKGLDVKIVRPFQILGCGISLDDGRLHADFIGQMLKGDRIVLKGDGTPRRTFLYATDAVIGMLTIMLKGKSGEAYNLVWEENEATVLELAETMAGLAAGRQIRIEYDMQARNTDPAVTKVISKVCGDSAKLRKLGWRAECTLREACARMMEYYGAGERLPARTGP